jgi:DNA polymerase III epsilon subunit-like protein
MKEIILTIGSTDLLQNGGRINHIAALKWEDGAPVYQDDNEQEHYFETVINPGAPENSKLSKFNRRITPALMQKAPSFSEVMDDLRGFTEGAERIIVFSNGFATPMLRREFSNLAEEEKARFPFDLYKFVHLQSVIQSNVSRHQAELENQKMETFAKYFAVNHPMKAIRRCSASLDVLTLSELYLRVRQEESDKINELLANQAKKKRKAESMTAGANLEANTENSTASSSSSSSRVARFQAPTTAAVNMAEFGMLTDQRNHRKKARREDPTETATHSYALRSRGGL